MTAHVNPHRMPWWAWALPLAAAEYGLSLVFCYLFAAVFFLILVAIVAAELANALRNALTINIVLI